MKPHVAGFQPCTYESWMEFLAPGHLGNEPTGGRALPFSVLQLPPPLPQPNMQDSGSHAQKTPKGSQVKLKALGSSLGNLQPDIPSQSQYPAL